MIQVNQTSQEKAYIMFEIIKELPSENDYIGALENSNQRSRHS